MKGASAMNLYTPRQRISVGRLRHNHNLYAPLVIESLINMKRASATIILLRTSGERQSKEDDGCLSCNHKFIYPEYSYLGESEGRLSYNHACYMPLGIEILIKSKGTSTIIIRLIYHWA